MWQGNPEVFSFGEELPPSFLLKRFLLIPVRYKPSLLQRHGFSCYPIDAGFITFLSSNIFRTIENTGL
jgi:hypothetical protein